MPAKKSAKAKNGNGGTLGIENESLNTSSWLRTCAKPKKGGEQLNLTEGEILYPLAMVKIKIDLDEGAKVNYGKFGDALKEIPGL